MRIHFRKGADLGQVDILAISESNYFIECENKWKRLRYDFGFFDIFTVFRNLSRHNGTVNSK